MAYSAFGIDIGRIAAGGRVAFAISFQPISPKLVQLGLPTHHYPVTGSVSVWELHETGRAGLQARVEAADENPSAIGTADQAFSVPPLRGSDSKREVLDAGLKARSTRTIQTDPPPANRSP